MRVHYANGLDVQILKTDWPNGYSKARVEGYVGAHYNASASPPDYTSDALFRWETDTAASTDSIGIEYFRYFYDVNNNAAYDEWRYEYDTSNQAVLTKIYDPNNAVAGLAEYTADGHRKKTTTYGRVVEELTFGTSGAAKHQMQDRGSGGTTSSQIVYDSLGRSIQTVHPAQTGGSTPTSSDGTLTEYDSYNQITKVTMADDRSIYYQYNARGDMTKYILSDDNPTTPTHPIEYWYNDFGIVTKTKNPLGKFNYYTYIDEGCTGCGGSAGLKLSSVEDDDGHITNFEYDHNGNQTKVTDALGRVYKYYYNNMNRLTKVEDPDQRISTFEYDIEGHMTKRTDPTGKVNEVVYDHYGHVISSTDVSVRPGHDITVTYAYDKTGKMTLLTDGNGNESKYFYSNGRLSYSEDEVGKRVHYFYDTYGRMTKTGAGTSGTVDTIEYFYKNSTEQLTKITYSNNGSSKDVVYEYAPHGVLTRVIDWLNPGVSSGHYFEFDATTGNMTRYRDFDDNPSGTRKKIDYAYNYAGQVTSMTDYDGNVTTYTYTDTGQLSTLTAPGSKVWDFDYNAIHQRTQVTYPNGMKAVYGYDTANRLTKIEYNDGAGSPTVLDGWEYELADDGNILRMASLTSSQRWDYGYDGKNRLTSSIRSNASGVPHSREEYVYDDGDNMLTRKNIRYSELRYDDFTDGDYTANPAWTVGAGSWAVDATGKYLYNAASGTNRVDFATGEEDTESWFRYRMDSHTTSTDRLDVTLRYSYDYSPPHYVSVKFFPGSVELTERYNGTVDTDNFHDADTLDDQWYQVYIRCVGSRIEVWRGKDGEGLELVAMREDLHAINNSVGLRWQTYDNTTFHLDDVRVMKLSSTSDSFIDDFNDGSYVPEWAVSGSWGVAGNYLSSTSSASAYAAVRTVSAADNQLKVSVKKNMAGNSLRVYAREVDSTHKVYVEITDSAVNLKQQDGSTTTLDTATLTTTVNTWYDYHIICDGKRIEVWRGPQGGTTELILDSSAVTILGTDSVVFATHSATASFENVEFIASDPKTTTFAYNGANELTTMTEGSTTTTYTYDDWGRTLSKTDGTYSASYVWRFGDKLKEYNTSFPGEGDVAFNYDGLGKRRNKLSHVNGVYSDADWTWYRWDAGWNMIGEYAAGTDTGTEWDAGALTRWYQSKGAHADGDPDSTAYNYYLHDHLGSPRATYNQSKAAVARLDSLTYGTPMTIVGQDMDLGITGHKWDAEMVSFYAPYRYYSSTSGRWLSRDPLGMGDGPNLYQYSLGNPASFLDPEGGVAILYLLMWMGCPALVAAGNRLYYDGLGRGGMAPGTNDDYKHCTATCRASRYCINPIGAGAAGIAGEFLDYSFDGNREESFRDMCSNADGLKCSRSSSSCSGCCKSKGYDPTAPHDNPHPCESCN